MALINVGDRVLVKNESGFIRFIGPTKFAPGQWVGIELDRPVGKNNGSLQGIKYFDCAKDGEYGIFVRPNLVISESTNSPLQKSEYLDTEKIVIRLQDKLKVARQQIQDNLKHIDDLQIALNSKTSEVEELEMKLEGALVDQNYLHEKNSELTGKLAVLEAKYNDIFADYAILQEESELNRELENIVKTQFSKTGDLSKEDLESLIQHNKKLEVALHSLEKLSSDREVSLRSEIANLNKSLENFELISKAYSEVSQKLEKAEATIQVLQEQLESVADLAHIIEHLTQENELLQTKVSELNNTIKELTELNELDRSLEEYQLKMEQDLRKQVDDLLIEIRSWKGKVSSLSQKNEELKEKINNAVTNSEMLGTAGDFSKEEELRLEVKKLKAILKRDGIGQRVTLDELELVKDLIHKLVPSFLSQRVKMLVTLLKCKSQCNAIEDVLRDPSNLSQDIRLNLSLVKLRYLVSGLKIVVEWDSKDEFTLWDTLESIVTSFTSKVEEIFNRVKNDDIECLDLSFVKSFVHKNPLLFDRMRTTSFGGAFLCLDLAFEAESASTVSTGLFNADIFGNEFATFATQLKRLGEVSLKVATQARSLVQSVLEGRFKIEQEVSISQLTNINEQMIDLYLMLHEETTALFSDDKQNERLVKLMHEHIPKFDLKTQIITYEEISCIMQSVPKDHSTPLNNILSQVSDAFMSQEAGIQKEHSSTETDKSKSAIIEELNINIDLLEKNMASMMDNNTAQTRVLQEQLSQAKEDFEDLQKRYESLKQENELIDNEIQNLLQSNSTSYKQIPYFENLKEKRQFSNEMALVEEIMLLKEMINRGVESNEMSWKYEQWLLKPLLPSNQTNGREKREARLFIDEARQRREQTLQYVNTLRGKKSPLHGYFKMY